MEYFRFAYPIILYCLIPILLLIIFLRIKFNRQVTYKFSMTSQLIKAGFISGHWYRKLFFLLRLAVLCLLVFLIARPQWVDVQSSVTVEGIDIVLVLDASGSMSMQDEESVQRSRFDIAKQEAIHFIEKRDNDAIGLVIFANDAISRAPITPDKNILKTIISETDIGFIDPDGTKLSTAIITAANRLKRSKAKSKVMIVLTDGEPTPGDMKPKVAIEIAKKLGIKIYTIGIGSDQEKRFLHPLYGVVQFPKINKELLQIIAKETGGSFFHAQQSSDMREIYDTIDTLEKTEIESPIFSNVQDFFMPFLWLIFVLVFFEILLSTLVWFGL